MAHLTAKQFSKMIDLDKLKMQWSHDPNWNIEDTPGFEEYHDQLLAYRLAKEAEWKAAAELKLNAKAESLGVPGNLKLAEYVLNLEQRLAEFDRAIDTLCNPNP